MFDYKKHNLNVSDELVLQRKKNCKIFKNNDTNTYRTLISSGPMHYYSPPGYGSIVDKDSWEDIDNSLLYQETPTASYDSQYIMSSNIYTVGFRNDKEVNKFIGIRYKYDDNVQFEITPIHLKLNSSTYDISKFNDISISSNNCIIHRISSSAISISSFSNVEFHTTIGTTLIRNAVKVNDYITDFSIKYKLDLQEFAINNTASKEKIYNQDEYGRYHINSSNPHQPILTLNSPYMYDSHGNVNNGVSHKLYQSGSSLYYEKHLTNEGKEWMLENEPPYFIDANLSQSGATNDGYVGITSTTDDWTTIVNAETGTAVNTTSVNSTLMTRSFYSNPGKGTITRAITRSFFYFSTQSLPSNITLTSASLKIYGCLYEDTYCSIFIGTQITPLTTADYDSFGNSASDDDLDWDATDYNEFTLNSTGLTSISNAETTKFCIREYTYDVSNTEPDTAYSNGGHYAEGGSSYWPLLDITYSIAGVEDCQSPGDISISSTDYGNEIYMASTYYGNERRLRSTCC